MIRLPVHVVGELPCGSQPTAPRCVVWSWHLTTRLGRKGSLYTSFPRSLTDGYAMLMSPSKGETAVHGCHCLRDMAVRMCEVITVGLCMCASYFNLLVTRDPPSPRMSW